jgi:hypothetical protein
MSVRFLLRAGQRGYSHLPSVGLNASYIAGHPDGAITRHSSFNFHEYQAGIPGFGAMKVFGDEVFTPNGTGYNMHPHHNFIIVAVVLGGTLTHINTIGKIDELGRDDYYVFSAGSGGKHSELTSAPRTCRRSMSGCCRRGCWPRPPTAAHVSIDKPAPTASPAWSATRRARCPSTRRSSSRAW